MFSQKFTPTLKSSAASERAFSIPWIGSGMSALAFEADSIIHYGL
jgi:hypothetical protein